MNLVAVDVFFESDAVPAEAPKQLSLTLCRTTVGPRFRTVHAANVGAKESEFVVRSVPPALCRVAAGFAALAFVCPTRLLVDSFTAVFGMEEAWGSGGGAHITSASS
jgi:hypothetical protein